ncbi:MAG: tRNA 4-thiouridine(8) synthase ThiI [Candidatus Aenigmarchaeota archaeon]|nr:tRNA 4-thiouridine(8) synthase ThiI [Candidatus Aenigmarchaeota archaeon]
MECIGIHYPEISLKGNNRQYFVRKLRDNMRKALKGELFSVETLRDRIVINFTPDSGKARIAEKLKNVFGISHFYLARSCGRDMRKMKEEAAALLSKNKTFKIKSSRAAKDFLNSPEINKAMGEELEKNGYIVDLEKPEVTLYVDILKDRALLYTEKIRCAGGLPVGSSGKAVVLFSGGIDSPVAAWHMMKRGCRPVYVHFYALRNAEEAKKSKIGTLVDKLSKYSQAARLYLVPYDLFALSVAGRNELILFRRFMNRVAERIAEKENAKALVTGESVGQVASQTLDNISASEEAVTLPILRPLIGMNKDEIIAKAEEIGTYQESIKEYKDCCSIIAVHPKTRAKLDEIKEDEAKIDMDALVTKTLEKAEIVVHGKEAKKL